MTEFANGQPVANRRSGAVSWVLIAGADSMMIVDSNNRRINVNPRNYEPAGPDIPWSFTPSTSYGVAAGGWSE